MIRFLCAWYCAILLWLSGTQHAANKYFFFGSILDYQLLPNELAAIAASVMPGVHLMLAAALIAPGYNFRLPFTATAVLGVLFVALQLTVLARGIPVDCGCFGAAAERPVGWATLSLAGSLIPVGVIGTIAAAGAGCQVGTNRIPAGSNSESQQNSQSPAIKDTELRNSADAPPSVSIIIPVYNEAGTISQVLQKVRNVATDSKWNFEIIVVNDGSTDETGQILTEMAACDNLRILTHPRNRGKGAAIRTALEVASRELTIIQDADLEYEPDEINALIQAMRQQEADVVYGSRVLGAQATLAPKRYNIYAAAVWLLNITVRVLYGLRVTDEATCYKLFRTKDLKRMHLICEGFEFCPEVTAKLCRLGLRVIEVPISYTPRSVHEGKKIRFRDGLQAIHVLWRLRRWNPPHSVAT